MSIALKWKDAVAEWKLQMETGMRCKCLIFFLAALSVVAPLTPYAAPAPGNPDRQAAEKLVSALAASPRKDAGKLLTEAAKMRLGSPYVAGLLDPEGPETLQMPFVSTDCMIFVETCLAAVLTSREADPTYEKYMDYVRLLRYRGAEGECPPPVRYETRLHYATAWIRNLVSEGIAEDLTLNLGGIQSTGKLDFMSRNYKSYKQIAAADTNPEAAALLKAIALTEDRLNEEPMTYVPKARIRDIEGKIKDGDIIFFTTSIAGLDVSHMAVAYRHDGIVGFIHASTNAGKVIVDPASISGYALSRKSCTGIKVVRVKEL